MPPIPTPTIRKNRPAAALLERIESRTLLSGVTVITHGYEPYSNSRPGWIDSMGAAVLARAGGGSVYALRIKSQLIGSAKVDYFTKLSGPDSTSTANSTGETILLVDWADASSVVYPYYSADKIAALVIPYLTNAQPQVGISAPLAQRSIQLMGHSRGASVVSEIARKLGTSGIWVDQLTTFDPVPVGSDPDITVLANTIFADNYYETNSATPGKAIANAYNVGPLNLGGAYPVTDGGQHNDTFLFYYGTIDTSSTANNGDHPVNSSWYPNNGLNRNTTGFYYSRIGGAAKPASGLSYLFGGSASRPAVTRSGTQWGNITTVSTAATSLNPGQGFTASYRYQSVDGASTIAWYLDPDKNPYNGNEVLIKDPALLASTGESVYTVNANLNASATPGTYFLFGKVRKGTNERVAYSAASLQVKAVTPPTGTVDQILTSLTSGWAIDTDTPTASIQVRVDIDGTTYTTQATNILRPDVNTLYATSGSHGFSITLPTLAGGTHTVSVYAIDSTNASAVLIRSAQIISPYVPVGSVDGATSSSAVYGWALDQDTPSQSISVRVDIDGTTYTTFPTDTTRSDVNSAFSTTGDHGFSLALPTLAGGTHTISVYALDSSTSAPTLLGTRIITSPYIPAGVVDSATRDTVYGWAYDNDTPSQSISVRLDIDGTTYTTLATNAPRPDVNAAFSITGTHGYSILLPTLSVGIHRIDVYALDSTTSAPTLLGSRTINTNRNPVGSLDAATTGNVAGWAWDQDTSSTTLRVRLDVDNFSPIYINANLSRTDVDAYTGGPHAFSFDLPQLISGSHTLSAYAIDSTSGNAVLLATQTIINLNPPSNPLPLGYVDGASTSSVFGWAYDPNTTDPINVRVDIDGATGTPFLASEIRDDVTPIAGSPNHGFTYALPQFFAPGSHILDIYALDSASSTPVLIGRTIVGTQPLQGSVDSLSTTVATGWAFNPTLNTAPAKVRIDVDDLLGALADASGNRQDLIPIVGSPDHGFLLNLPPVSAGTHRIRIYILDDYQPALLLFDNALTFT